MFCFTLRLLVPILDYNRIRLILQFILAYSLSQTWSPVHPKAILEFKLSTFIHMSTGQSHVLFITAVCLFVQRLLLLPDGRVKITSFVALCLKISYLQFSLCPWRVKLPEREIGRSPPSTAEGINVWVSTLIRPISLHGVSKGKFDIPYRLTLNRKFHKAVGVLLVLVCNKSRQFLCRLSQTSQ